MTICTICSVPTETDVCPWCQRTNLPHAEGRGLPQPWWMDGRVPLAPCRGHAMKYWYGIRHIRYLWWSMRLAYELDRIHGTGPRMPSPEDLYTFDAIWEGRA